MRRIKAKDRRRFKRRTLKVKTSVPVLLSRPDGSREELNMAIIDISEGGMRVKLDVRLPEGEFNLLLEISNFQAQLSGQLILPCETVWKRHLAGESWVYGLEFVTSQETCEVLIRLLQELTTESENLQTV